MGKNFLFCPFAYTVEAVGGVRVLKLPFLKLLKMNEIEFSMEPSLGEQDGESRA
jgi:hypothetical protein